MDLSIPKKILNNLNNDILDYQNDLLKEIYQEYLVDKVSYNSYLENFKKKDKTPKIVIRKREIKDEDRCCAKVWINGNGYRCNKHKCSDIDYCKIHLYKRNYGRFDD